jgi:hypothetical protein
MEKERTAGVPSRLPAASIARTRKEWLPCLSPPKLIGEEHACHAPPSRRHSNVLPFSEAENENVADFPLTEVDVIVVLGATVSTFHVLSAGEGSFVPAESFARTLNVCEPCGRPV